MDVTTLILAGIVAVILWTLSPSPWVWGLVAALVALVVFHLAVLWAFGIGVVAWAAARSL